MSYLVTIPDNNFEGSKPEDLFLLTTIKGLLAGIRTLVKDDQGPMS
jgi:hypothetical protein